MIGKNNWTLVVAALAILTLTVATRGWAHGPSDRGEVRGPGVPGEYGFRPYGGLLQQLIYPCRSACVQAEQSCAESVESAAVTCATQTCDAEVQSAQTDCAASRMSQTCRDDISALRTCVEPCVMTQSSAITTCLDTFKTCLAACNPTPTPTP